MPDHKTPPATPGSRPSLLGGLSCFIALTSGAAFAFWWYRFGRVPVHRQSEYLSSLSGFLDTWTLIFYVAALLGCGASAQAILQRRRHRGLAYLGLALNATNLITLVALNLTSPS